MKTRAFRSGLAVLIILLLACKPAITPRSFENAPPLEWYKSHSGSGEGSHGHYIIACSDGGFLQTGETFSKDAARILLVKTDSEGDLLWKKEYGTAEHNFGNGLLETADGNYLFCGSMNRESVLMKLDAADGEIIWKQNYSFSGENAIEGIDESEEGGFICAGYQDGQSGNAFFTEGKGLIMKTDSVGNMIWWKDLSEHMAQCYRVKHKDGNYLISGLTENAMDFALIRANIDGEIMWSEIYGGEKDEHCFGMDVSEDGSIFLTGHTRSGNINWDTYTVKVNPDGSEAWNQTRGNPRGYDERYIHDEGWGVRATPDGGCLMVAGTGDEYPYSSCESEPGCSDQWCIYLIKYSKDGDFEWEQVVTASDGNDWAGEDVAITNDGGCIVATDDSQFGFHKFESFGETPSKHR